MRFPLSHCLKLLYSENLVSQQEDITLLLSILTNKIMVFLVPNAEASVVFMSMLIKVNFTLNWSVFAFNHENVYQGIRQFN